MRSNSILTETEVGTYYTGPLEPAQRIMRNEYGDDLVVIEHGNGSFTIEERRGSGDGVNQWGTGDTEEEAWRYLIGADFGPLDDTYDSEGYEAHQRSMLGLPVESDEQEVPYDPDTEHKYRLEDRDR